MLILFFFAPIDLDSKLDSFEQNEDYENDKDPEWLPNRREKYVSKRRNIYEQKMCDAEKKTMEISRKYEKIPVKVKGKKCYRKFQVLLP